MTIEAAPDKTAVRAAAVARMKQADKKERELRKANTQTKQPSKAHNDQGALAPLNSVADMDADASSGLQVTTLGTASGYYAINAATGEKLSKNFARKGEAEAFAKDIPGSFFASAKQPAKAKAAKGKKAPKASAPKVAKEPAKQPAHGVTAKQAKKPAKPKVDHAAEVANIPLSSVNLKTNVAPSVEIATQLQQAFDHFNVSLFEGKLEPVIFSNVRLKKSLGHFWAKSWTRRTELKGKVHEIGMDFARLQTAPEHGDKLVLSTLVHEMCHELIEMKAIKENGHGKYWVAAMLMVGLEPIILNAKGVPTGKATGSHSSHKIIDGDRFDAAAKELLSTGFKFVWANEPLPEPEKKPKAKKKAGAKAKHTCPSCNANAWGKPSMVLTCTGTHDAKHEPTEMLCDREEFEGGGDKEEGEDGAD